MASSRRPPSPSTAPGHLITSPARPTAHGGRRPTTWTTPGASPLRVKIETASRGPLLRMSTLPRWLLFLPFLGVAVGAGVAPGVWGALCAFVLAAFLGWLLFLAWPKLEPRARAVRLLVIGILVAR